jgi:anti-sigma factor RsiW
MKCEELLAALNEYVDGQLDPALCAGFEKHLADCNPCQVVIDNIRQTITLYKAGEPFELPPEFRQRLHDVLRRRWREKFTRPKLANEHAAAPTSPHPHGATAPANPASHASPTNGANSASHANKAHPEEKSP